ncbi:MAG: HEAT repeat domain-containing protein [bacterium]|nr:HEAT repeat domain-containing protein [bacterium]
MSRWILLPLLAFVSCAGAPEHQIRDIGRPDAAMLELLAKAERAYRAEAPEYPALRDQILQSPTAAGWHARTFVRDFMFAREQTPLRQDQELLRAAAKIKNPVERRAVEGLIGLGEAAMPVLIDDVLLHDQTFTREIGVELIGYLGLVAMPAVIEVTKSDNPRHRRAAARALAAFAKEPDAVAALRRLVADSDFTVRADAVRGLRGAGPAEGELLGQLVQNDEDEFVRRVAAGALAGHPGRETATLLVDYLAVMKSRRDMRGYEVAQETLQELAGARGPRTVEAWRRWAEKQPAAPRAAISRPETGNR